MICVLSSYVYLMFIVGIPSQYNANEEYIQIDFPPFHMSIELVTNTICIASIVWEN